MKKLDSLRAFLVRYYPEFERNPDKLQIYAERGNIVSRATSSLSSSENLGFEYRMTVHVVALDYTEDTDTLVLPLLLWLRQNERALFLNHDKSEKDITFATDIIDDTSADISISFPLTEAVDVMLQEDGQSYNTTHRDEPRSIADELLTGAEGIVLDPAVLLKKIYADGDLLVPDPNTAP